MTNGLTGESSHASFREMLRSSRSAQGRPLPFAAGSSARKEKQKKKTSRGQYCHVPPEISAQQIAQTPCELSDSDPMELTSRITQRDIKKERLISRLVCRKPGLKLDKRVNPGLLKISFLNVPRCGVFLPVNTFSRE